MKEGLFLTHRQPSVAQLVLFFQVMDQRVVEWSAKVALLPRQPIPPTRSTHCGCWNDVRRRARQARTHRPIPTYLANSLLTHLAKLLHTQREGWRAGSHPWTDGLLQTFYPAPLPPQLQPGPTERSTQSPLVVDGCSSRGACSQLMAQCFLAQDLYR